MTHEHSCSTINVENGKRESTINTRNGTSPGSVQHPGKQQQCNDNRGKMAHTRPERVCRVVNALLC
jgi:hypothetical protein